jgi:CRISPR system Cascade subunit CasA
MVSLNLLTGPLIRFETRDGLQVGSLPDVFAVLMADRVESFPALRAHQEPAWHMFLVQLGAIACHHAGLTAPPTDTATWANIICRLTRNEFPGDEPWCLVVDDWSKPAFLQPPVPEDVELKNDARTPDALDMLITSRNHDLKQAIAMETGADDWVYALVSLQTMEGFGGRGNYGIARMNGGSSSRVMMALVPTAAGSLHVQLRPGIRLHRDIIRMLRDRNEMLGRTPIPYRASGGLALTWVEPWPDGVQLALDRLDIWFIEACRRVRLRRSGRTIAAKAGISSAERLNAKHLNGVVGDPWAPVHHADVKTLTIGDEGDFHYTRLVELLFSGDWQLPVLAELGVGEPDIAANWFFVVAAIARGNSKTGGFKSRAIPLKGREARGLLARRKELHQLATEQIEEVKKIDAALRNALALANAGGDREKIKEDNYKRTRIYRDRLDVAADRDFFPALWRRFETQELGSSEAVEDARRAFLVPLIEAARDLLEEGLADIPCPSIRRPRAEARARRQFASRLRGEKTGFPAILAGIVTNDEETIDAA